MTTRRWHIGGYDDVPDEDASASAAGKRGPKVPEGAGFFAPTEPVSSAAPLDVVDGIDPAFALTTHGAIRVTAHVCPCGYRLYTAQDREQHARFGHPASCNPDLTCQATAPWDHERWCIRAKGHEGDHWTPSAAGGAEWVNR